jgi:endonuclease III
MENLPLLKQIIATGNQTNKKLDDIIKSLGIVKDAADDVRQTAEEIEKEIEIEIEKS